MTRKVIGSDHIGGRRYLRLECGHYRKAPWWLLWIEEEARTGWSIECRWCNLYGPLRPVGVGS